MCKRGLQEQGLCYVRGAEKHLGSDACARSPNTLHHDLVPLWPPFCPLPPAPYDSSLAPPGLTAITFAVYLLEIVFPDFVFLNLASLSVLSFEVTS